LFKYCEGKKKAALAEELATKIIRKMLLCDAAAALLLFSLQMGEA
jgi:hypothetical protein